MLLIWNNKDCTVACEYLSIFWCVQKKQRMDIWKCKSGLPQKSQNQSCLLGKAHMWWCMHDNNSKNSLELRSLYIHHVTELWKPVCTWDIQFFYILNHSINFDSHGLIMRINTKSRVHFWMHLLNHIYRLVMKIFNLTDAVARNIFRKYFAGLGGLGSKIKVFLKFLTYYN